MSWEKTDPQAALLLFLGLGFGFDSIRSLRSFSQGAPPEEPERSDYAKGVLPHGQLEEPFWIYICVCIFLFRARFVGLEEANKQTSCYFEGHPILQVELASVVSHRGF